MKGMLAILALTLSNLQAPAADNPPPSTSTPTIWGAKVESTGTLILGLVASPYQVVPITDPVVCWKEVSPCPYSGSQTISLEGPATGKKYEWKLQTYSAVQAWDVVVEGPKGGKVTLGNQPYAWSVTESSSDKQFSRYKVQLPKVQSTTTTGSCPVPVQCP